MKSYWPDRCRAWSMDSIRITAARFFGKRNGVAAAEPSDAEPATGERGIAWGTVRPITAASCRALAPTAEAGQRERRVSRRSILKTGIVRWQYAIAHAGMCTGAQWSARTRNRKPSRSCRAPRSRDRWTDTCAPTRPSTARFSGISTRRRHFKPLNGVRASGGPLDHGGAIDRERQRVHQLRQCPAGLFRRRKIGRNKYPWHVKAHCSAWVGVLPSSARRRPRAHAGDAAKPRRWKTRWSRSSRPCATRSFQALDQAGAQRGHRLRRGDRRQTHPDQCARRAVRQPGADPGECRRRQALGHGPGHRPGHRSRGAAARRSELLRHPSAGRARQRSCRRSRIRCWPTAFRPAARRCPSPRASSRASNSPRTTIRCRGCAFRSMRPSIPATAAVRPSPATR